MDLLWRTENQDATVEDAKYLEIIAKSVRVCAKYKPKFGQGRGDGLTLEQFRGLYQGDPFYSWFGPDNPMMYAAHKAAGGMTSIYRQIGIGCENVFRQVLQIEFRAAALEHLAREIFRHVRDRETAK